MRCASRDFIRMLIPHVQVGIYSMGAKFDLYHIYSFVFFIHLHLTLFMPKNHKWAMFVKISWIFPITTCKMQLNAIRSNHSKHFEVTLLHNFIIHIHEQVWIESRWFIFPSTTLGRLWHVLIAKHYGYQCPLQTMWRREGIMGCVVLSSVCSGQDPYPGIWCCNGL